MTAVFTDFEPITPHDSNQAPAHQALWIGGAGDLHVEVELINDAAPVGTSNKTYVVRVIAGITAGRLLPFSVHKVRTTSTCTDIVACRY